MLAPPHTPSQLIQIGIPSAPSSLQDLRSCVKAAKSHREKCAGLLSAATAAVLAMEDVLYSPGLDVGGERVLQQLAARVQVHVGEWGG